MAIFYFIFIMLSLIFGSFLNALEWRIKKNISLLDARSVCPTCKHQLAWYDNIPLLSYTFLRGKCRRCHKKISLQYPLVELTMALFAIFIAWFYGADTALIIRDFFIVWLLLFIFIYDMKYMEVLDSVTLGGAFVVLVVNIIMGWLSWQNMLIGVAIGGGFFLLQYVVSKGRWIGGGDIRIGILMGVILGWQLTLLALWIAYIGGAIVSVGLLLAKKKKRLDEIAFGTYLAVATVVVMFVGEGVLKWYLGLIM